MSRRRFTVTHPDGTVDRRTSETMSYTHAIVRVTRWADVRAGLIRQIAERAAWIEANPDSAEGVRRFTSYNERDAARLAATPTDGHEYVVLSWSQTYANAAKRCKPGQLVVPVDAS